MGIFGAALLYGDGMITPAISVLGAMEGLTVAAPLLNHYVVPITIVIIVALFIFQSRGTARIGKVFGPQELGDALVGGVGGVGALTNRALPGSISGHQPASRLGLLSSEWVAWLPDPGFGIFSGYRRGGALR